MEIYKDLLDIFMKLTFWIGTSIIILKMLILIIQLVSKTYEYKESKYDSFISNIIYYTSIYYMFSYIF